MKNENKIPLVHIEEIVEIARVLFDTKGFDHTTIRDITSQIGMSEEGFSLHFKSTDEILEAIWSGP